MLFSGLYIHRFYVLIIVLRTIAFINAENYALESRGAVCSYLVGIQHSSLFIFHFSSHKPT
jgi:hypothetical protein